MSSALFGILQLDRGDPLGYAHVAGLVQAWLQDAGGFAAVGLVVYLLYALSTPTDKSRVRAAAGAGHRRGWSAWPRSAWSCYAGRARAAWCVSRRRGRPPEIAARRRRAVAASGQASSRPSVRTRAAGRSLLMVGRAVRPARRSASRSSATCSRSGWRRIWALSQARLQGGRPVAGSLWVFLLILLPFLFPTSVVRRRQAGRRAPHHGRRDHLTRHDVLVLFPAVLLASFGIPNDIKNLTIHTVVTKPVERFEIVLGRFLGYVVADDPGAGRADRREPGADQHRDDRREGARRRRTRPGCRSAGSWSSRPPAKRPRLRGDERRPRVRLPASTSPGARSSPQRAIWQFADRPVRPGRGRRRPRPGRVHFDIFKHDQGGGEQGRERARSGSSRTTARRSRRAGPAAGRLAVGGRGRGEERGADEEARAPGSTEAGHGRPDPDGRPARAPPGGRRSNELAEEFGYYEIRGKEVFDYAVDGVEIPAGLFRNALQGDPGKDDGRASRCPRCQRLREVREPRASCSAWPSRTCTCSEANQPFAQNFVKGMFGLWCRLCIVIGLAVACSTYLSGVLSLLATAPDLPHRVLHRPPERPGARTATSAAGRSSRCRGWSRPSSRPPRSADIGREPGRSVVSTTGWAWVVRRIQNVIPDVDSFTWTPLRVRGVQHQHRVPGGEPAGHGRLPAPVGRPGVLPDEVAGSRQLVRVSCWVFRFRPCGRLRGPPTGRRTATRNTKHETPNTP